MYLLVLYLVIISHMASGADINDGCRQMTFTPEIIGKALRRHVIRSLKTNNCELCQIECFLDENCVSYNCGNGTCDINSSDHFFHPADLVVEQGKIYRATENACKDHGCAANATCLQGFTEKGYMCKCVAGLRGDNCDEDIDECKEHNDSCSPNATCINTVGSYECNCNNGYHGDGVHCSEIKYAVALEGQSCRDHCALSGKICVEYNAFPSGSAVNITVQLEIGCAMHTRYTSSSHPAINKNTKNCLGTEGIPSKINCQGGGNGDVHRICPCVEVPNDGEQKINVGEGGEDTLFLMQPIPDSVIVSLYPVQATITVVLNLLSIIVFWKRRVHLKRASYFLVNLAVADTLVGMSQFTSAFLPPSASHDLSFSKIFVAASVSASLSSLVLISLERLFAVWKPLLHRVSPKKYYYIAISLLWPSSVVNGVLWMIYVDKGEGTNVVVACILVAMVSITLCIISSSYVTVWYMVILHPRPVSHNREQNKQLTKTLFIVTALSLLTWVPSLVGTVVSHPLPWQVNLTVSTLLFGNSLVDPLVYIFRMQEFRDEIKRLLCRLCA